MKAMRIAFFASHNGSNMQAIIDACRAGRIQAEPCLVISNNSDAGALVRARNENIPAYHLNSKIESDPVTLDRKILDLLKQHDTDLVVLAGYMRKLGPQTLAAFTNRILNIHPALLPKYGGRGMYGMNVHEAVLAAKELETGASVHIVTENYDEGPVIAQRIVPVLENDTANSLAARVLQVEYELYVNTIAAIANGEIDLTRGELQ